VDTNTDFEDNSDYEFDEERSVETEGAKRLRQQFLSGVKATLYYGTDTRLSDVEGRYSATDSAFVFHGGVGFTSYYTRDFEGVVIVLGSGRRGRKMIGEVVVGE
jgi:hypothetical protein